MAAGLKGNFYATAVGSVPYKNSGVACEKIIRSFKDIPFWPQLVRRSFLENMYVQFSERLPSLVVDQETKSIYIDTQKDTTAQLEELYDRFIKDDVDFFSISQDHAGGLYGLLEALKAIPDKPKFIKGQITGPVSFGLTVTDDKKRSLFYTPELKEALVKTLCMRARWQIRRLKETGADCVMFIDEPYLTSIGSSIVNLKKEEAFSSLIEIIQAIHKEGALSGIHCCGNTDWGFLLGTGLDILNFDAHNFSESVSLYPEELKGFLKRGGVLAWGIIPNTYEAVSESYDSLFKRLETALGLLTKKGIEKKALLEAMIITPSCGLGLIDEYLADIVIDHTVEFSNRLRKAY